MAEDQNPINNLRREYSPLEKIGRTAVGILEVGGSIAKVTSLIAITALCGAVILMWPVVKIHEIRMYHGAEQSRRAFERERVLLEKNDFNLYSWELKDWVWDESLNDYVLPTEDKK